MGTRPGDGGSGVEVATDGTRPWLGHFLRTTRPVDAGGVLVREKYVTFVSLRDGLSKGQTHLELYKAVVLTPRRADATPEGEGWGRWGAGLEEIRALALDAGDEDYAAEVESQVHKALRGPDALTSESFCFDDLVYLARVFGKNAFSFGGEGGCRHEVIFGNISRASHSCEPNATIREGGGGCEALLVALRPLEAGTAVNICYLPDDHLLRSTAQRRATMQQEWGFRCRCVRCEEPLDRTRRFALPCPCGFGDFAAPAGGDGGDGGALRCLGCGGGVGDAALERDALASEADVEERLQGLAEAEDLTLPAPDTLAGLSLQSAQALFSFAKAHPHHRASAELLRRRVVALHAKASLADAAESQGRFVRIVEGVLPKDLVGLKWLAEINARHAYLSEVAGRRDEACWAAARVLDNLQVVFNYRPVLQTLGGMFDCERWHAFLDEVAGDVKGGC